MERARHGDTQHAGASRDDHRARPLHIRESGRFLSARIQRFQTLMPQGKALATQANKRLMKNDMCYIILNEWVV